ncbi:MAG: zinc ABC transporter substrate-binding protein, partial [Planctomycetes bacterium]|nr:zinc ABC transporter substrate-binding protein [Planctomycetota bacterium]
RLARQRKLIEFLEAKEFRGKKLIGKLGGWLGEAQKFRGQKIITFHQAWVYFADRFGLVVSSTIEEKPGIPPSAKRKDLLIQQVKNENIRVIAVGTYYDTSVPEAMAEATGAKLLVLPVMTEGVKDVKDYFGLFDYLIGRLRQAFEEAEKERGSP